jgi:hypothetical protein
LLTVRQTWLADLLGDFPDAPQDVRSWSGAVEAQLPRGHGLPLTLASTAAVGISGTVFAVQGARWSGVTMVALAPAAERRGE